MPSPTYALTRLSSQSPGAVFAWNSASGSWNGSIATAGSTPSSASRSARRVKCRISAVAMSARAASSVIVGASEASAASRSKATSSV